MKSKKEDNLKAYNTQKEIDNLSKEQIELKKQYYQIYKDNEECIEIPKTMIISTSNSSQNSPIKEERLKTE